MSGVATYWRTLNPLRSLPQCYYDLRHSKLSQEGHCIYHSIQKEDLYDKAVQSEARPAKEGF